MTKTFSSIILSTLFTVVLFANASAATSTIQSVTAVGTATSSMINSLVPIIVTPTKVNATASTSACTHLLTTYHKMSSYGTEVAKLQVFLNQVNGANLNGKGYFGPVTEQEVRNFQYTYGIKPTGYQHMLTTKIINDIHCGKVLKKARMVYVEAANTTNNTNRPTNYNTPPKTSSKSASIMNVASSAIVKEYTAPKKATNLVSTNTNSTSTVATGTSFWENLSKDWDKIKDNYKAYLLVFALVFALFWFLRKAATE